MGADTSIVDRYVDPAARVDAIASATNVEILT